MSRIVFNVRITSLYTLHSVFMAIQTQTENILEFFESAASDNLTLPLGLYNQKSTCCRVRTLKECLFVCCLES